MKATASRVAAYCAIATFGAVIAMSAPSPAKAQAAVQGGVAARADYNDNYFFTPVDQQSAYTGSITPFVTAARLTEVSDATALLAVGANKVWGLDENIDYWSGRFGLNGSFRDARSTWTGNASFVRAPSLQNDLLPRGVVLRLVNTNSADAKGSFTYALAERWALGATAGGYGNRYDSLESDGPSLPSNRGYNAGGNVSYSFSDRTKLTLVPVFSHFASDITRSDYVTTTLGIVHQFSPQLTISVSAGGAWGDTESIDTGERRHDNGQLYGGNISYALSERTRFSADLVEGMAPSGTGTITRSDIASISFTHSFSDRLAARIGGNYARTRSPDGLSNVYTNKDYRGEVGVSYLLAELWRVEAGYRYSRAQYSQNGFEPKSNVAFLSIGYNWLGTSYTGWVGRQLDNQGLPGAGPVPLLDRSQGSTGAPSSTEGSPFDRFTIP